MKAQKFLSLLALATLTANHAAIGQTNTFPPSGYVGIGTTVPGVKLEVTHNGASTFGTTIRINQDAIGNSDGPKLEFFKTMTSPKSWSAGILNGINVDDFVISEDGGNRGFGTPRLTVQAGGYVGIGTIAPVVKLEVTHNGASTFGTAIRINQDAIGNSDGPKLEFFKTMTSPKSWSAGILNGVNVDDFVISEDGGNRGFGTPRLTVQAGGKVGIGTTEPKADLDVAGTTRTQVLEITGGSDLAEPFEVEATEAIKPGMVVAINPDKPGQLRVADKAYDHTVAGIISGANGVNPGLTMKQEGTVADGSFPVSLTGRVYCWADASFGTINPGDLLTTSDSFGHAMKVTDHSKAQGAIIGKAMSVLEGGKGLVLVLVSLQ